ncbi:hypothetical protein Tco_0710267 [Tanacetum coccineum]
MPDEVEVLEEINVNVVTRRNRSKRYFSLLLNALSVFDREDLCALYQLVMDIYQDEIPQGFDRILYGDLTTMFHLIELDEVWKSQQNWNIVSWTLHNSSGVHTLQTNIDMIINMLVEKKYPLMKKILLQMLKGLSVAGKCALWFGNLEARNRDEKGCLSVGLSLHNKWSSFTKNCMVINSPRFYNKELATPEQTATGKEISNPLIADSLLKTTGSSMHLVTAMKH